jgi:hypothetical protein
MFMTPANKYVKFHQNPLSLTVSGLKCLRRVKTSRFVAVDLSLLFLSNGISFFLPKKVFIFCHSRRLWQPVTLRHGHSGGPDVTI